MGYDKATVSRAVNDVTVTNALLDVKDNFIQWPKDINSKNRMKCGFHRQMNFPNVLGCIDCTHVKIQGPSEDEAAFVNRKAGWKFTNISANWPGSTHDSHIFNTSNLCHYLETNNRGLADGLILGDSGYACRPFLMTPYPNPRERHQQRFNRAHSSTRSIIERAFGILKRRFHVFHSEQDQPVQVPHFFLGEQDGRHPKNIQEFSSKLKYMF
ncbi:HARBI1 [Mytilus coruscus]|uniref:HARBI1 n=1 Tax=Mytilus coruscus TaxID=42192 RepID=A0A6J8ABZ1_MYTCO|nr:HARBI1 [Mytilus coruscus]